MEGRGQVFRQKNGKRQCLIAGERLVLAAFESWESLNVVVAVYREEREVFSARYLYGGTLESNMGYGFVNGIEPLGNDYFIYSQERGREIYIQEERDEKAPLAELEMMWECSYFPTIP